MSKTTAGELRHLFYTGTSRFLETNGQFVSALVAATAHCAIHASEDIVDATGLKLWAAGQPVSDRLLERLASRRLKKPIELCVYAADPIAAAGICQIIETRCAQSPELQALLAPHLAQVLHVVRTIGTNPTELMLFSVMRHCGRDMLGHAATVAALAIAAGELQALPPELLRTLARAALLHDVGELYLEPEACAISDAFDAGNVRTMRSHVAIGAQVASELARAGPAVEHLIALSHERLDGWGYPHGLQAQDISLPAQALLFAEAMTPLLDGAVNGLRRCAIAARLVPGEFPAELVAWVGACSSTRPIVVHELRSAHAVGMDLLQIQALLARLRALLTRPNQRETAAANRFTAQCAVAVQGLIDELSRTGIESAIGCGMSVEPQDDVEMIELSVLGEELLSRIRELRLRVELAQADQPDLSTSVLVLELLELLRACERYPGDAAGSAGGRQPVLAWSKLYSVGIRAIDEQHEILVGLLNRLGAAGDACAESEVVAGCLARLVAYVGEHFAFEEDLMERHGYSGAAAHAAAHGGLAGRVTDMVARHHAGADVSLAELTVFLRQWLISHILHTDMALGVDLNGKGIH